MSEIRLPLSVRVPPQLLKELSEAADLDKRKLNDLAAVLMEWSFAQFKAAGSVQNLLKSRVRPTR